MSNEVHAKADSQSGRHGSPTPENYYINPERFTEMLITYQETGNRRVLEAIVSEYFYPLAIGIIRKTHFKLIDYDDAVQECVVQCVLQIPNFNPNHATTHDGSSSDPKYRAFAFFTTCSANVLRGMWRKAQSIIKGRRALFINVLDRDKNGISKTARRTRNEVLAGNHQEDEP